MLFDTHAHMDDRSFDADRHELLAALPERGISLLMNPDRSLLEVIDMRMGALAQPVYEARKKFVEDLKPIVKEFYKAVSGGSEDVDIEYESELSKAPLEQLLAESYEKDRVLKYTTAVPASHVGGSAIHSS